MRCKCTATLAVQHSPTGGHESFNCRIHVLRQIGDSFGGQTDRAISKPDLGYAVLSFLILYSASEQYQSCLHVAQQQFRVHPARKSSRENTRHQLAAVNWRGWAGVYDINERIWCIPAARFAAKQPCPPFFLSSKLYGDLDNLSHSLAVTWLV